MRTHELYGIYIIDVQRPEGAAGESPGYGAQAWWPADWDGALCCFGRTAGGQVPSGCAKL